MRESFIYRSKDGGFMTPSIDKPRVDGSSVYTLYFSPLSERMRNSINGKYKIAPFIIMLLFLSSPFTVGRLIISVVVDSFDRHFGWPYAHINKKIHKRITPSATNRNASSPIVFVVSMFRIYTSLKDGMITFICRCSKHSMSSVKSLTFFFNKTTTGLGISIYKTLAPSGYLRTTFTFASPIRISIRNMGEGNNTQPKESSADKVKTFRHDILRRCSDRLKCVAGSRNLLFGMHP